MPLASVVKMEKGTKWRTVQKCVLIVEDNAINRAMLTEILSPEYAVLEAENGREALSVLKEHGGEISLILLDICMPIMDGYAFLAAIKANPVYAAVPVIVTTQSDNESDEVSALAQGAADFVAKPYKPQVILHRVANIINLRENAAMVNQFRYDRLTGLYSKEFFYRQVKEILAGRPEQDYDIICSDIENFKLINDVFGVPAGDRLLCEIAKMYTRKVGERGVCSRFQADQFVCLLEHQWEYTDEMFQQVDIQINNDSNIKNAVMKWGIYSIDDRTIPIEQMCDRAFLAATSIKGQYGKHFAAYDDNLRRGLLRRQAITDVMEDALAEGQFEIYLQPKYSIRDEKLAGAEALVRWNHPEWGMQSPAEFIPLFEQNGFITKLDQFVWNRACACLREWDDKGYPPISISVNVSRADIYQADITDLLTKTVKRYGLSPERLHLEITESAYTENPEQLIQTVGDLRDLGFVVEMDDFGSGYSSLNMISKMPIDVLKLDMKFIQNETAKRLKGGILRFIIDLARWMKLSVVAEGVETREQLERLREIGCDYVQGYYFARPSPCGEFEQMLQRWQWRPEREAGPLDGVCEPAEQILLVADEDPAYRTQVRRTFDGRYRIAEAADSDAALEDIERYEGRLAAVILSLTLPGPGDFPVLKALQREKKFWDVPIIATAPADDPMEETALEMGADEFIGKPHSQKKLLLRTIRAVKSASSQAREHLLRQEAHQDYLTGLLNRCGLLDAVQGLCEGDMPAALYLFDLDDLKRINDMLGHMEGDRMIRQFGALLRAHTRASDIVARFGGDEFVVVMRQMRGEESALEKGEKICRAFREAVFAEHTTVTCTAGVVLCEASKSVYEMIGRADQALYRAKNSAKGTCQLWKE